MTDLSPAEREWLDRCLAEAPALSDALREELAELPARERRATIARELAAQEDA